MTTTEKNKLIAKFMGFNHKSIKGGFMIKGIVIKYDKLLFHSDWNWLMEVVEKIESLNYNDFIIEYTSVMMPNVFGTKQFIAKTKIEAVYNACIEFIKWYNQQKSA